MTIGNGDAMDRARFMTYVGCFNARDFDGLRSYWASDVELELPPNREGQRRILRGPDAIVASYTRLFGFVLERLQVDFLAIDGAHIACEMNTTFEAVADHPEFVAVPLRRGDVFVMNNFVHFDLADGLFRRIRVAGYTQDTSRVHSVHS